MTIEQERVQWAEDQLGSLGFAVGENPLVSLVAWATAEGGGFGNVAANNPLNSTEPCAGSYAINSVGVQAYPSYADGIAMLTETLENGYYPSVLMCLREGSTPATVASAIGASPWGTPESLVVECIPESQTAVATYWTPPKPPAPKPPEDEMFITHHSNGAEFVVQGSRRMPVTAAHAPAVAALGLPTKALPDATINLYVEVAWGTF